MKPKRWWFPWVLDTKTGCNIQHSPKIPGTFKHIQSYTLVWTCFCTLYPLSFGATSLSVPCTYGKPNQTCETEIACQEANMPWMIGKSIGLRNLEEPLTRRPSQTRGIWSLIGSWSWCKFATGPPFKGSLELVKFTSKSLLLCTHDQD
jgi:hypothetical protein